MFARKRLSVVAGLAEIDLVLQDIEDPAVGSSLGSSSHYAKEDTLRDRSEVDRRRTNDRSDNRLYVLNYSIKSAGGITPQRFTARGSRGQRFGLCGRSACH